MKSFIKRFVVIALILLNILSGCTAEKTIKIGVVGTLSGPTAELGILGLRGIEMAVEKINLSGGINARMIELVVKDSLNDEQVAKGRVTEFVDEGVNIVIGDFNSELSKKTLETVNNNDILYLSPLATSDYFTGQDDNFIRFIGSTLSQAEVLAGHALINGDNKFLIFKDNNNAAFTDGLSKAFREQIENQGGQVINQCNYDSSFFIYTNDILEAMDEFEDEIDSVLIIGDAMNASVILQTIRSSEADVAVYSSIWGNTENLYMASKEVLEGLYIVDSVDLYYDNESYMKFEDKYKDKYGTIPYTPTILSYDTMMALKQALETDVYSSSAVKKAIINISEFSGLQGDYRIDEFGDCDRAYYLWVIKDGRPIMAK